MSLYASQDNPPEYQLPTNPSFNDLVNSETQKNYLQGASTYFYYNLEVWKTNQQPTSAVQLVALIIGILPTKMPPPCCQTIVEYSDGLGRLAEKNYAHLGMPGGMPDGTLEKYRRHTC